VRLDGFGGKHLQTPGTVFDEHHAITANGCPSASYFPDAGFRADGPPLQPCRLIRTTDSSEQGEH
jgi:hypothetical protein